MSETFKLYRDNPYQKTCEAEVTAVTEKGIQLNQTLFFGEAGGQIGDTGRINGVPIGDGTPGPMWRRVLDRWSEVVGKDIYRETAEARR